MTSLPPARGILHVAMRECRLVTERILLTLGLPQGCIAAIRESIVLSHAMKLGGFKRLHDTHATLAKIGYDAIRIVDTASGSLDIDGGDIHAWLIAQTTIDLAVDIARRHGSGTVRLLNVSAPEELAIIKGLATRYGAEATVETAQQNGRAVTTVTARNAPRPRDLDHRDPYLAAAIRHHLTVEEPLWRALYQLSNTALAPDSVVSRRHAGPVILLDDGTIVGRLPADDDFDPKMLKKPDPTKLDEGIADGNRHS